MKERNKRILFCVIGMALYALGAAICKIGNVGVDACTAFNMALAQMFHVNLGVTLFLFNFVLLGYVFKNDRHYIGIGTLLIMSCIGFVVDGFVSILQSCISLPDTMLTLFLCLCIGLLFSTLGIAFFFTGDLGIAPYDAVGKILHQKTKAPYAVVRIGSDVLCTVGAFILQGPIGIGTILMALCIGPCIQLWCKRICIPLLKQKQLDKKEVSI